MQPPRYIVELIYQQRTLNQMVVGIVVKDTDNGVAWCSQLVVMDDRGFSVLVPEVLRQFPGISQQSIIAAIITLHGQNLSAGVYRTGQPYPQPLDVAEPNLLVDIGAPEEICILSIDWITHPADRCLQIIYSSMTRDGLLRTFVVLFPKAMLLIGMPVSRLTPFGLLTATPHIDWSKKEDGYVGQA